MAIGRPQKFTAEEVATALRNNYGILWHTAEELGCNRRTVQNYIERYPTLRDAAKEQDERVVDLGEHSMIDAILRGEAWAVSLVLKTKGKERGYVERTEQRLSGANGGPIENEHRVTLESYAAYFKRLADDDAGRLGDAVQSVEGHGDSEPVDSSRSNGKAGALPDGILS